MLSKREPFEYPISTLPGEVVVIQFKTVGVKVNAKINIDLHVHYKVDPLGRGNCTNVVNSGPASVFTEIGDKIYTVSLVAPNFKITNAVKSVMYLTTDSFTGINISEVIVTKGTFVGGNTAAGGGFTGIEPLVPGLTGPHLRVTGRIDIVCEGLMLGHSGFAKAMRNVTYGLDRNGCNVRSAILDADSIGSRNTNIGKRVIELSGNSSVSGNGSFYISMNFPLGIGYHPSCYNIAYIMYETVDFPQVFVNHLRSIGVNEIWTPSSFCRDSMVRAGLGSVGGGIHIMPLGVDSRMFSREHADEPRYIPGNLGGPLAGKFKFLTTMGYSERKGVSILIRAFVEEFGLGNGGLDAGKVALYFKGGWYDAVKARSEIESMIFSIPGFGISGISAEKIPYIAYDFNIYSDEILASLYKACDAFVLPSRGEGFSLPMAEAMSMGMPTIGTRWSGNLEFMNDENSYLIGIEGFAEEPRCNWVTNYYIGQKFAVPSLGHLKQMMRHVYENQEEAKRKGRIAREHMVNNFDWSVSCSRMKKRLIEIANGE